VTLETAILRRTARLFRIVHFHWSTMTPASRRSQGQAGKRRASRLSAARDPQIAMV
jgi:hypothetical protein